MEDGEEPAAVGLAGRPAGVHRRGGGAGGAGGEPRPPPHALRRWRPRPVPQVVRGGPLLQWPLRGAVPLPSLWRRRLSLGSLLMFFFFFSRKV